MSQVQLTDKLVGVLVSTQEQVPAARVVRRTVEMLHTLGMQCSNKFGKSNSNRGQLSCWRCRFIDRVVDKVFDRPGVVRRQMPMVQTELETVEGQQLQLIDKVIDIRVVAQRQIPMLQTMQNTIEGVAPKNGR